MRDSVTVSIALEISGTDGDAARDAGGGVGLAGDDVGVAGKQQHVVVRQADEAEGVRVFHVDALSVGAPTAEGERSGRGATEPRESRRIFAVEESK